VHSVGIDLGKTTFHLVALDAAGKVLVRKKFTRMQLLTYTATMQVSLIGSRLLTVTGVRRTR
jgi:transposase